MTCGSRAFPTASPGAARRIGRSADRQIAHYRAHLRPRHLDVGVGTGFYLQGAQAMGARHVALVAPNPSCLATARARLGGVPSSVYCQDALQPLAIDEPKFESIGISYLVPL